MLKKEYSCTSAPPLGLRGLYEGELYLYLYLSSMILRPNNHKTDKGDILISL